MPNRFTSALLSAIRVVCYLYIGPVHHLDHDGELIVKMASPDLYGTVCTSGEMVGVGWEDA